MSMAITTRYHGPTNTRGSRIKALARKAETWGDTHHKEMSLTDSWDHAHSIEENHARVAKLLATKLGWAGVYVAGALPDGTGNVFVCVTNTRDEDELRTCFNLLNGDAKRDGRDYFHVMHKQPSTKDCAECMGTGESFPGVRCPKCEGTGEIDTTGKESAE